MNNYSNKKEKTRKNVKVTAIILATLIILNQIGRFFLRSVTTAGENIIIATMWQTIVGAVVIIAAVFSISLACFMIYVIVKHMMKRKK